MLSHSNWTKYPELELLIWRINKKVTKSWLTILLFVLALLFLITLIILLLKNSNLKHFAFFFNALQSVLSVEDDYYSLHSMTPPCFFCSTHWLINQSHLFVEFKIWSLQLVPRPVLICLLDLCCIDTFNYAVSILFLCCFL